MRTTVATRGEPRSRRGLTRPGGRRPISPRRRQAPPPAVRRDASASVPTAAAIAAAEGHLISDWQHARDIGSPDPILTRFLLEANESLIDRALRATRRVRLERGDLEQAATIGLLVALGRFDPYAGKPFGPYAYTWIRKELQRTLAAGDFAIAVPAHLSGRARAAAAFVRDAPAASDHDLATTIGSGIGTARGLRHLSSVSALTPADVAVGPAADIAEGVAQKEAIASALAKLDPQASRIIRLRHGLDDGVAHSTRAIAGIVGVSDFTVRARLARAHEALRRLLAMD